MVAIRQFITDSNYLFVLPVPWHFRHTAFPVPLQLGHFTSRPLASLTVPVVKHLLQSIVPVLAH
jgi:hypothetical protein